MDGLESKITRLCVELGKTQEQIASFRKQLDKLENIPLEVAVNRHGINQLYQEQKNAKRLFWRFVVGIVTAVLGAGFAVIFKVF